MIRQYKMMSLLIILLISSCFNTSNEQQITTSKWDVDTIKYDELGESIYIYSNRKEINGDQEQTIISKILSETINETVKSKSMVFNTTTVYYKQVGDSLFLYVGKDAIPNDLNTLNTKVKYILHAISEAKEHEYYSTNYINLGMKKVNYRTKSTNAN